MCTADGPVQTPSRSATPRGTSVIAENPTDRFRQLFAAAERDLLAYALRRVDRAEDAADIVAETFLVAWRRLDDVPAGDEARLWLTASRAASWPTSAAGSCGARGWPAGCATSCP
ncbi:MAG: subfamily polymerase sigma-24 subunit, partial [Solirubrobacterales bacterium]|nr:subfamily polymerase sigma-24 subunit [Solirubrobacterales bacterium]